MELNETRMKCNISMSNCPIAFKFVAGVKYLDAKQYGKDKIIIRTAFVRTISVSPKAFRFKISTITLAVVSPE